MIRIPGFVYSFRTKVTVAMLAALFAVVGLNSVFVYEIASRQQFLRLTDQLKAIVRNASLMLDADSVTGVPLNPDGLNSQAYRTLEERLTLIKRTNPLVKYVYIMKKTEREGVLQFVVDLKDPELEASGRKSFALPGEKYDAQGLPELLKGFEVVSADQHIAVDYWGATLSGYAPVIDKEGRAVAVLGIDVSAGDVYRFQRLVYRRLLLLTLFSVLAAVVLGLWFSQLVSRPVKELVSGTRAISKGDLSYKVKVKGRGEIKELADSFNEMALNLMDSRKKLHEYFYRIVQALVRGLEAKDKYTAGHSDRVAEYAYKTAKELGVPAEKTELLKEAAQLHDIGKLGIHEDILNKKTRLDEKEWGLVQQHPAIGEEILKPISLDEDFLAVVRSHHERYDGTGYPDKLKNGQINILAQIACVCDSYDAMTSDRSYRAALTKEQAIVELQKKSGTQFNPEVVAAFIKAIQG